VRYGTHPSSARKLPALLNWLVERPPTHACIMILLAADLAALGDALTGPHVWFGPVYLLVICLAAWARGLRSGLATGIGCMGLTFLINGASLYPYAGADWILNFAARLAAITMVVVIVASSRSAYIREWWLARTDPLTGAFNRQAFFELGGELVAERGWRLLIYADLDGLKRINDVQGHSTGDRALEGFAAAVRGSIRRSDLFARVGGDEFVILMSVRDRASAEAVARRIHGTMNSLPDYGCGNLRCSVGALIVPPGEIIIDHIVRTADTLMYEAKLRGACLQVQIAEQPVPAAHEGRSTSSLRIPNAASVTSRAPSGERRGVSAAVRELAIGSHSTRPLQ